MEHSSRHPRFQRLPMFRVAQGDGRFMMTNTLDPERQRLELQRGQRQRTKGRATRQAPTNAPPPIEPANTGAALNCYTLDFYRHLLGVAEQLTTQQMFNDLIDLAFHQIERDDPSVLSQFSRYQFFVFAAFILRFHRYQSYSQHVGRLDAHRAGGERDEPPPKFELVVNDVKNALSHDILDMAMEIATSESRIVKAKERKVYEFHAAIVYLQEALGYIEDIDKVKIEDVELRIFRDLREKQRREKLQMGMEFTKKEEEEEEGGGENKLREEGENPEGEGEFAVTLSRAQILKIEAHFISERVKKHLLHRELLSVGRFGLESWKPKEGVQLRNDLMGFVDGLAQIMERYTSNKIFRVVKKKRKRARKIKKEQWGDADDEEEAAIVEKIEREERQRMADEGQQQEPQDEEGLGDAFLRDVLQENEEQEQAGPPSEESEESDRFEERSTTFHA